MKKVILDSNIFIRFLIKDIPVQFSTTQELFIKIESNKLVAYVSILVINEVIWILENYYELDRKIYLPQLIKILALKNIRIIETKKSLIFQILEEMQNTKIDFTDYYLSGMSDKREIISFDKDFKKMTG